MMQNAVLRVIREDGRWAIDADGDRLALARTKRGAEALARQACEILRASGADARVEVEPRSFKPRD